MSYEIEMRKHLIVTISDKGEIEKVEERTMLSDCWLDNTAHWMKPQQTTFRKEVQEIIDSQSAEEKANRMPDDWQFGKTGT